MTATTVAGNYNITVVNHNYSQAGSPPSNDGSSVSLHEIVDGLNGPDFLRIYEEALSQRLSKTPAPGSLNLKNFASSLRGKP
ncbi:hypothetical protein DFP72DRAFT_1079808 [Ephemerocybe angulata]|uniref:Uncharacterized protein n=1 Tax=Ephemerocybe angulata TaxID=980116 RepID=A0A8H6HBW9_9AGAR|nr:hypothetical protein DFP72DRAFT_1079808 [Tulosesus angulatus]